jgi:hypothetical protein
MKRSVTSTTLLRVAGAAFFVLLLLAGLVPYFNYTPAPGPASVTALANRGGALLVLRTPPGPQGQQDDIVVAEDAAVDATIDYPRAVWRGPAGQVAPDGSGGGEVARAQLTPEQWQALDTMRTNWCTAPPLYFGMQPGEPVYDTAVGCGLSVRRVRVPVDELPPEIEAVLAEVPPAETE